MIMNYNLLYLEELNGIVSSVISIISMIGTVISAIAPFSAKSELNKIKVKNNNNGVVGRNKSDINVGKDR